MNSPSPTISAAALLRAEGLGFDRNDEPIFGPLDFHVEAGEAVLVHGSNGSGKTTLLRVLAGLLRASRASACEATRRLRSLTGHRSALGSGLPIQAA